MEQRKAVGLAGAALLIVGVFVPLVSLPIVGSLTYFNNGKGDGIFVLGIAVLSILFVLAHRFSLLWLSGIASLALIGYSFVNMTRAIADMQLDLAGNPFGGLVNAQMQWGWAVLVLGSLLLLVAAAGRKGEQPQPEAA